MHAEPSCKMQRKQHILCCCNHLVKAHSRSIHTVLQVSHPGPTLGGGCKYTVRVLAESALLCLTYFTFPCFHSSLYEHGLRSQTRCIFSLTC